MLAEADVCTSGFDRLRWAWGCWTASLLVSLGWGAFIYAAVLACGLSLMAAYEWSADESRTTVTVLCGIAFVLGTIRPRRAALSGLLIGLVVTGVTGFEAVSGIHPGYETRMHTVFHSLYWLILLVPALAAATAGGRIGRIVGPAQHVP